MTSPELETAEKAFNEELRADLLRGRFRPGEWLKQADLEALYKANRFEVRIALSELAARHLLEHIPNRGYRVAKPSDRQRDQLYETRSILETAAARLVVTRISDADIDAFAELVHRFQHAIEHGGREQLRELNFQLHDKLYRASGNDLLADQIRELRERGSGFASGTWDNLAGVRRSNADHLEMLEMLRRRDGEALAHSVYRHLNRWREFLPAGEGS